MAFLQLQRLMECAKAIEGDNLDVAASLLESVDKYDEAFESTRRVVKYCAEALVRRAYGIRPLCPPRSLPFLFEATCHPFFEFAQTTTEYAIKDINDSTLLTCPSCQVFRAGLVSLMNS
ncbi:zinc finger BED domain-containing protein [Salix suchowensis]|nr:zinc finger BED domain-containing protein [Salix suchowensis]